MESNYLQAVHLLFSRLITDIRQISARLMEHFDVQRIVYLKKSPKEKTLLKSAVVILKSAKNTADFCQPVYGIGDLMMDVVHLTIEDAEDLIDQKKTKLYVGNIPYPVDNLTLWNYFAQFGELDYSYILKPPVKRGAKGFGFVIYQRRESARLALEVKNYMEGIKLNCKLFMNKTKLRRRNQDPENNQRSPTADSNTIDEQMQSEGEFDRFEGETENLYEERFGHGTVQSEGTRLVAVKPKVSWEATFGESLDEEYGFLPHATILADDELPIVIPNMHITQIFGKDDYLEQEPEYLEFLVLKQEQKVQKRIALSTQRFRSKNEYLTGDIGPIKLLDVDKSNKPTLASVQLEDNSPTSPHPCGCDENRCTDCWCDMIDSTYFSPPCCICDFRPDPIKCHMYDDFILQNKHRADHCLHPPEGVTSPHEPWEHEKVEDCRPCSKYVEIKAALQKNPCQKNKEYKLFQ